MAAQFVESIDETANTIYYAFTSKVIPFEEEVVDTPKQSVISTYDYQRFMIFAKNIQPDDISRMVRNIPWKIGKTYDMYDDRDPDLYNKNYYVVSEEPGDVFSIFKCIYNASVDTFDGVIHTPPVFAQPLSSETYPGDDFYRTADGYVWRLMCTMTRQEYEKFATSEYVPIMIDPAVVDSAANGTIDYISIETPGKDYNAYAYGSVRGTMIGGDPRIISLQTDDEIQIYTLDISLQEGEFIQKHNGTPIDKRVFFRLSGGSIWEVDGSPVSGTVYAIIGTSILRVLIPSGVFLSNSVVSVFQTDDNTVSGTPLTARANILEYRLDHAPTLSSNTDFYKNSSFYIRSGTGAGQLMPITEYIVSGNERRVFIEQAFSVLPDVTSRFEIGPRLFFSGDGTGSDGTGQASAIATVDPTGNTISFIEIVDPGKDYTYASILIQSNTGIIDVDTGLSMNAESAIVRPIISPPGGHGSDICSELNSKYAGVSVSFEGDETGRIPVQNGYRSMGLLKEPRFANAEFEIADNSLIFNDEDIINQPSTGATAEVSNRQANTLRVRNIRGFFETGSPIFSSDGNTSSVINSIDRSFDVLDQRIKFSVEITNMGPLGTGFLHDELVTQEITDATGYVYSLSSSRIDLIGVKGIWNISDDIAGVVGEMIGTESGAVAKITGRVDGDIMPFSGQILYTENTETITRAADQTERLKLILEF